MAISANQAYLAGRVKSATPAGLVVLLYEGLVRFALDAKDSLSQPGSSTDIAAESITKCLNILTELNTTLKYDVDPVFCLRMSELYTFFAGQFSQALHSCDPELIGQIIPLIEELADGWREAENQLNGSSPKQSAAPKAS